MIATVEMSVTAKCKRPSQRSSVATQLGGGVIACARGEIDAVHLVVTFALVAAYAELVYMQYTWA